MTEARLPGPPRDESEMAVVARAVSALARELAPETERRRRLADPLVAALRESGLLRGGAPLEVGGLELAPGAAL